MSIIRQLFNKFFGKINKQPESFEEVSSDNSIHINLDSVEIIQPCEVKKEPTNEDINNHAFLEYFSYNYQKDNDFEWIKFDWNGKHGDDFFDKNVDFRMLLCEYLIDRLPITHLELIRDLYIELSRSSEQTFGVYRSYHLFANELLLRGKTKYFMDYLKGASYSFDTGLASGRLNLDISTVEEIVTYIDFELTKEQEKGIKGNLEFAKHRFDGQLKTLKNN